jgi:rubrerythrin
MSQGGDMDILEYAMKMEKDGEQYYRRAAEKVNNKGIKTILSMLADEEVKHYNALARIQAQQPTEMAGTVILADAKNVFEQMNESDEKLDVDAGQTELYKEAQRIEEKSRDFYLEKAEEVSEEQQKELFLRLAEEEKKHYFLLENIIEFVSRPEHWLENAEFCHLEEY